ncbi:MAG: hypothetical protein NT012_01680 [Candidatus Nealsonbacteria bacterium]|nr:hypothetical protein [Candidatus Nealsonbacteria bacterium]
MKSSLAIVLLAIVLVFLLLSSFLGCGPIEKDASFYDDQVLQYLGKQLEDIMELYGEPDIRGTIPGPGGEFLYYREKNISFIFAGDEKVVNNLELFPGGKVLGVQVGMSFDEIEQVLGPPRWRDYDPHGDCYSMVYWLGEEQNDMGEVEMWFCAASNDAPTKSVMVLWKKYLGW